MIRKSAGVVVLGTIAAAVVVFLGGTSQGETPPGEHATAWTPPAPNAVPLDCANGMTLAPAPPANPHAIVPAGSDAAGTPAAGAATAGASPSSPSSPTLQVLAEAMTVEARAGFPGLVAGLLRYDVTERAEAEATLTGTLGGRRLVLAPAVRNADGTWSWRDARPVLNPNGAWVVQGTMIACNEVFDRA